MKLRAFILVLSISVGMPCYSLYSENPPTTSEAAPETKPLSPSCSLCQEVNSALQKNHKEEEHFKTLLGKNQLYLTAISSKEASKFLKVKSNVSVILEKLDAVKAKRSKLEARLAEKECEVCL